MIFNLPDAGYKSRAHETRSKHWIKRLDGVDQTKRDGYAFIGEFRRFGGTEEAPEGTHYLAYLEDRRGSGKLDGRTVQLYRVTSDGLQLVEELNAGTDGGWALRVRDHIADLISHQPDRESLRAEKAKLLERVAEIDRLLGEESGT